MNGKQYADEARARWGETDAYKESERRTASYGKADWQEIHSGMTQRFAQFAALMRQMHACRRW